MDRDREKAAIIWDAPSHAFIVTTPPCEAWAEYPFGLSVDNAVHLVSAMVASWPGLAHALVQEGKKTERADLEFLRAAGIAEPQGELR
jgi:hypothetical protein